MKTVYTPVTLHGLWRVRVQRVLCGVVIHSDFLKKLKPGIAGTHMAGYYSFDWQPLEFATRDLAIQEIDTQKKYDATMRREKFAARINNWTEH